MSTKPKISFDPTIHISFTELCATLNISKRTIQMMIDGGYIVKEKDGFYQLNTAVQGAMRYRKDHGAKKGTTSKEEATTKVHTMRAAQIEQEMKITARDLVPRDEVTAMFDLAFGVLRSELDGLPSRFTRDREQRARLETEIHGSMARCNERWEKAAQKIEQEAAAEDDE